jgi:hypothetical protein
MSMQIGISLAITGTVTIPPAEDPGPTLGPELWPQPEFDADTGLTLNGWTVSSSLAQSNAQPGFLTATALDTLVPGTYRVAHTVITNGGGDLNLQIGGTTVNLNAGVATGSFSEDVVIGTIINQVIRMRDFDSASIILDSFSIKQVL